MSQSAKDSILDEIDKDEAANFREDFDRFLRSNQLTNDYIILLRSFESYCLNLPWRLIATVIDEELNLDLDDI